MSCAFGGEALFQPSSNMQPSASSLPRKQAIPRLRLRIIPAAEAELRGGHPWLYAGSIAGQNREGELGELAVVFDRKNRFLAIGLFDPESPLRMRVLHRGKPQMIDAGWWLAHLRRAVSGRDQILDDQTTGCRLINGESDGWPGLVLDRYADTLVMKLYTAAWLPRLRELTELLGGELRPEHLVLRLSRNIQELAAARFQLAEGVVLRGPPISAPVIFLESGLRFEAEVMRGQKTGFFLDQRENRRRVESLAGGRAMLNAFSYSGGFSLYGARGGARSVLDLDISSHALAAARRNFALNSSDRNVAACLHRTAQADVFEWLAGAATRDFDLIVLDPPSLARRESERGGALRAYHSLVRSAIGRLKPRGILVSASCSAHVPVREFFETVRGTARSSGRGFVELGTTLQPTDHPARFPEAEYLKCIYLRLER
jgi:23S rRNA (cytosine1962-C5)-methyltransferase